MTDRRTTESGGMTCDEALEAAALEAAGAVEAATRERLGAHLAGCAACHAEVGLMRHALELLRAGETPDPGADYWRTFDARLRVRILRERSARRWRSVAGLAAAAIVVAGLWAWTAGRRGATGRGTPASASSLAEPPAAAAPGGPGPAPALVTADEAEARLDEVIDRLALQRQGERSFEAVLDEVLPAAPPGLEGDVERSDVDPAQEPDNC